jgi:ComF family protein
MWDALFVESCPACGGASRHGFCAVCALTFARVRRACPRCGLATPVSRCPLQGAHWSVDAVVAPFDYAPPLEHYVHALKYRGVRSLGRAFALLLAPALTSVRAGIDALVPVPLHRTRRCERGYNQAREIAWPLARELKVPLLERGIERGVASSAQTGQSARQRRASVARAFRVSRDLRGQRIAIIDDVVTTGATINALASELAAAGARSCLVFAVARTAEHHDEETPGAERGIEHDSCEHTGAEPGVVQQCAQGLHALAVAVPDPRELSGACGSSPSGYHPATNAVRSHACLIHMPRCYCSSR